MGLFKRKEEPFEPPELIHHHPMSEKDREMVSDLARKFTKDGVLGERGEEMFTEDSLETILSEAARGARYEKDINTEFYSPEVEAELQELERVSETWNNPTLDGVDDYGRQVYASNLTSSEQLALEDEEDDVMEKLMEEFKRSTDIA